MGHGPRAVAPSFSSTSSDEILTGLSNNPPSRLVRGSRRGCRALFLCLCTNGKTQRNTVPRRVRQGEPRRVGVGTVSSYRPLRMMYRLFVLVCPVVRASRSRWVRVVAKRVWLMRSWPPGSLVWGFGLDVCVSSYYLWLLKISNGSHWPHGEHGQLTKAGM